jgi:sulfur-oxidizing protein SoxY
MRRTHSPARRRLVAGSLLGLAGLAAHGAPGGLPTNVQHTDSSPEWEQLRAQLFQQRPIQTGGMVQLVVPLRAAYGASVPVKVVSKLPQTAQLYVKKLHLLVDKNPSKVAAAMELTPELGQADFETRLRVDEYSHVRVVTELSNGELHMDSRYVKVSGGCSAPPNRDQLHNLGKTAFKLPTGVKIGEVTAADVQVTHPNDTGFELNNITVMFIPPHFVRTLNVSYAGRKLFDAELDFSIAENPAFRFHFLARGEGELRAEVEDSKEGRFVGKLAVRAPESVAQAPAAQ